ADADPLVLLEARPEIYAAKPAEEALLDVRVEPEVVLVDLLDQVLGGGRQGCETHSVLVASVSLPGRHARQPEEVAHDEDRLFEVLGEADPVELFVGDADGP